MTRQELQQNINRRINELKAESQKTKDFKLQQGYDDAINNLIAINHKFDKTSDKLDYADFYTNELITSANWTFPRNLQAEHEQSSNPVKSTKPYIASNEKILEQVNKDSVEFSYVKTGITVGETEIPFEFWKILKKDKDQNGWSKDWANSQEYQNYKAKIEQIRAKIKNTQQTNKTETKTETEKKPEQPVDTNTVQNKVETNNNQPNQQTQTQNNQITGITTEQVKNSATKSLAVLQKFLLGMQNLQKVLDSPDFKNFDSVVPGTKYKVYQILQGSQYINSPELQQFGRIYEKIKNFMSQNQLNSADLINNINALIGLYQKGTTGDINALYQADSTWRNYLKIGVENYMKLLAALGSTLGIQANKSISIITHVAGIYWSISDADSAEIKKIPFNVIKEQILDKNYIEQVKNIYNTLTNTIKSTQNTQETNAQTTETTQIQNQPTQQNITPNEQQIKNKNYINELEADLKQIGELKISNFYKNIMVGYINKTIDKVNANINNDNDAIMSQYRKYKDMAIKKLNISTEQSTNVGLESNNK